MNKTSIQVVEKLKKVTFKDNEKVSLNRLISPFQSPEKDEDIAIFTKQGLPELRRLLFEGLKKAHHTKKKIEGLTFIMKILAMYSVKKDTEIIVKIANAGYDANGYLWFLIFEQLSASQHWKIVFDGIKLPSLKGSLRVVYLDFVNCQFIENRQSELKHTFDSEIGIKLLEYWLSSKDPGKYSYAQSATTALPFISEPAQSRLLKVAQNHPSAKVNIESAWAVVKVGDVENGVPLLQKWALNPCYSKMATMLLKELDFEGKIPEKAKENDFIALAEMASWLSHPAEYGEPPEKIEILDKRELFWPPTKDTRPVWLIKYTYNEPNWNYHDAIGMVGSRTFGFRSEMDHFSVEEIYGLHCAWELQQYEDPNAPKEVTPEEGLKILRNHNDNL